MGLLSRLFKRERASELPRVVAESPQSTLSTWISQLHSQVLSGQPSLQSKLVQNTTEFMDSLQGLILLRSQAEKDEADYRATVAAMPLLPHLKYNPRLYHDGMQWVAVWGMDPASRVVGRGDCPSEALNNFDAVWTGNTAKGDG